MSPAQFIHAAIACHLEQPGFERYMCQKHRQGNKELEEDMLEHIIDLIAIFEKAPNEDQ